MFGASEICKLTKNIFIANGNLVSNDSFNVIIWVLGEFLLKGPEVEVALETYLDLTP